MKAAILAGWPVVSPPGAFRTRFLGYFVLCLGAVVATAAAPASDDAGLFDLSMDQLKQVEIKSDVASIKSTLR